MVDRLLARRIAAGRKSVLLLGPRQVGKSTLCRELRPLRSVNLADEAEFLRYSKDPSLFRREIQALPRPGLVVVDEVQRVPALLNVVQVMLDDPATRLRFILTGSSARKLRRRDVNLLPGRVVLEHLDPLSCLELAEPLDLGRALRLGMLPGIHLGDAEAPDVLGSYAEVYLREEVRAEALTRNIGGFARFLDAAAAMSGQWLNYTKLASDSEIPKETVRRFVSLLEDTLLVLRLPSFQPRRQRSRRVSQRDRVLLFDVGVRNALLGAHRHPVTRTETGSLFEQWFILQVWYLGRALHRQWALSSYRTEGGAEVDLVVERDDDVVGIEIKASRNVGRSDTRGLASLADVVGRAKPLRRVVAYLGESHQRFEDGVKVYPYRALLEELAGTG